MACDLHRSASRDPSLSHFLYCARPFSDEACQAYFVIFPSVERAFFWDIFGLPVVTRYSVCMYIKKEVESDQKQRSRTGY